MPAGGLTCEDGGATQQMGTILAKQAASKTADQVNLFFGSLWLIVKWYL